MKTSLLALSAVLAAAALPTAAFADLAFNAGAVSDYRYRGISQSRLKPALQGGADYSNAGGLYVGTWLSTIKWTQDAGGRGDLEWDLYAGHKGAINSDLGYDVGGLYYYYPRNGLGAVAGFANANTFELYGALSFGPVTAKYSHALTDTFGFVDSSNSNYLDVSASFDLGNGFSLAPHLGHQRFKGASAYNYSDYSLTLSKDLGNGVALSLAALGTDANKSLYRTPAANGAKFSGRNALLLGAKFSF